MAFTDKALLHLFVQNKDLISQKKRSNGIVIVDTLSSALVIVPEEHKKALQSKGNHLSNDHACLLKRSKPDLLFTSALYKSGRRLLEKTFADHDKRIGRPIGIYGTYIKKYKKNIHVTDDLFFIDNKPVVPAAIRGTINSMLHETH